MELYELIIEDENTDEVFALSLVENPAIEADWVFFNNHKEVKFATIDEDKRTIVAPVLIPEKRIYRIEEKSGKEYEVFLTADTIEKVAQQFLKKGYQNKATIEHKENIDGDITVVESWVSKSSTKDKSANYFSRIFPAGTWFVTIKVNDDKLWEDYVKTGEVKAISIEGIFGHQLVKATAIENLMLKDVEELTDEESEIVLSKIMAVIKSDKRYKEKKRLELESYNDYPQSVRDAARIAREQNDKVDGKCMTLVGKRRAADLEEGRPLSRETIARMVSYLSRAKSVYEENKDDRLSCSYIAYKGWGGETALVWAENKLSQIDKLIEGAEVGPRGGIKESPKAPKSDTKNPEPKGEGTAKGDASGKRGAKVTEEQEKTLQDKAKEFNERDSNTKYGKANVGVLKSVFQRGLGAYVGSHSPKVQSASQWAFARVNAFLYLLKNGRPENPKYVNDNDLLPKGHPKAETKMEAQPSVTSTYPGEVAEDNKKIKQN